VTPWRSRSLFWF